MAKKFTVEQFWKRIKIKDVNECWDWLSSLDTSGYGQLTISYQNQRAHRIAWEITHGEIPKDKMVLHKCNNKKCCNPNHLYIGDHANNMTDLASTHRQGISTGGKLYSGEIYLIRKLKILKRDGTNKSYKFSASFVSRMFKVSVVTILNIWKADKWICREGYYV